MHVLRWNVISAWLRHGWLVALLAMGVPWPAHAADTCDPLKGDCAPFMLETFDRALDTKDHEYGNARGEHAAVVLRVGACLKGAPSPETWPPVIRSALMLGLNADYMHVEPASPGSKAVVPPLLPFQAAAVFFSDKVSRERLLFARAIENVRGQADRYNFLLVMVGGALTFLAGMQTVIGHSSRWRSLLAMGLGVIVILASSVNSSISRLSDYNANQTESLTVAAGAEPAAAVARPHCHRCHEEQRPLCWARSEAACRRGRLGGAPREDPERRGAQPCRAGRPRRAAAERQAADRSGQPARFTGRAHAAALVQRP